MQPGRDADHSPSCSFEVKTECELYFLPSFVSMVVAGQLYLFTNKLHSRSFRP
jgi:hypothetical protein